MRVPFLAMAPVLAALSAVPAGAQVSARLHLDIPLGRRAPVIYGAPRRQVIVREYDPSLFGDWDDYYDDWSPVTLYYYDGYYYDYPIVEYAEPVVVYSFRNQLFFPPRDRRFEVWRRDFRGGGFGRDDRRFVTRPRDGREFQSAPRNDGYGRQFQPAPRNDGYGRQFQPAPRNGGDGRQFQGGPRNGGEFHGAPPAAHDNGHGGRQDGNRGNGRSRGRP